ncbi:hypothetical protein BJX96DRAFT_141751 [Aspergillus floccosus]
MYPRSAGVHYIHEPHVSSRGSGVSNEETGSWALVQTTPSSTRLGRLWSTGMVVFQSLAWVYVQSRYGTCIMGSITFAGISRRKEKAFRQDSVDCVPSSGLLFTLKTRRQSKQRQSAVAA